MEFEYSVLENIRLNYEDVFSAEKKVADYILREPENTVRINVSELAEASGASDATVIRLCKHLGYKGFYQMKLQLAHDLGRDQLLSGNIQPGDSGNWEDVLKEAAANIIQAKNNIDSEALQKCVDLILKCNTVHLVAIGNSIPSTLDFAFRLGRLGIRSTSSSISEHQINNVDLGTTQDIVIGISHSGSSKQVLLALEMAKKHGMPTIAITDLLRTPLEKEADITISTGVEYSSVYIFGAASHIYITAILDILIYQLDRAKKDAAKNALTDDVEYLLSETKL